jgi:lathosterol oxidase
MSSSSTLVRTTGAPVSFDVAALAQQVVIGFVPQAILYFTVVGLLFVVIWKVFAKALAGRRIQAQTRVNRAQLKREAVLSLLTLAIGSLNAGVVFALHGAGYSKLSEDASQFTPLGIVASLIGIIVYNDTWFYWWHRIFHHPRLFRMVHSTHRKSVDVNPFSTYSFHAIEGFVLGVGTLPLFFIVQLYLPTVMVLQMVGLAKNLEAHLGYELLPRWYIRIPPFCWFTTSTYHNQHHEKFNGNYSLFFRFWDRLCGTEFPDYEKAFLRRPSKGNAGAASNDDGATAAV